MNASDEKTAAITHLYVNRMLQHVLETRHCFFTSGDGGARIGLPVFFRDQSFLVLLHATGP